MLIFGSIFTKFFQSHYLPKKYGFDKRLAHLSNLILSSQISREEALEELSKPLFENNTISEEMLFWTKNEEMQKDKEVYQHQ